MTAAVAKALRDITVAYRTITGLDGAWDEELRAAEEALEEMTDYALLQALLANTTAQLNSTKAALEQAAQDRKAAQEAYRELLRKLPA